ncbi:hypothetical protein [Mesorhizobium sp. NPDC059025]|uniref:hypothetical protein n=1 Tax=unclassified Mesorhizobium TaxID=325217 RepID=UPI0036A24AEE
MFRKIVFSVAAAAVFSMPAFAAAEFYVVKSVATKKCEIVDKKPDGTKLVDAGKKSYATKADAEKALKLLNDCK